MGAPHAKQIESRSAAIHYAIGEADINDIVLIAGKGHENYQEVKGVRHPFADWQEARNAQNQRKELTCE